MLVSCGCLEWPDHIFLQCCCCLLVQYYIHLLLKENLILLAQENIMWPCKTIMYKMYNYFHGRALIVILVLTDMEICNKNLH